MRPPMPAMRLSRRSKITLTVIAAIVVLLILVTSLSGYYLDYEWFGEVGQQEVFSTSLVTRVVLFFVFGALMAAIVGANVVIAYRLRPPFRPSSAEQQNLERYRARLEPRRRLLLVLLLLAFGLITGLSLQGGWQEWTLWLHGGSFGQTDPQFNIDISFYAWDYPVYRTLLAFGFTAIVFAVVLSLVVHYLFGAVRLQTPGPKLTSAARRHLSVLVFFFVVLKAISYWLDRYGLVFSTRGKNFNGASYTDINAALPAKTILFWVAIVIAILIIGSLWLRSALIPGVAFVVLLVMAVLINGIYPAIIQQFRVKPNANVLESSYISRNIAATRAAYGIETQSEANPGGTVSYSQYGSAAAPDVSALSMDNPTIENLRVLDPNVLGLTFTRQQVEQPFYGFADKLDIDRYTSGSGVGTTTKDYIVAARELTQQSLNSLNGDQTNWINNYTKYTHGYGFVAAAANTDVTTANASAYAEGGIPQKGSLDLGLEQPRIYFGEDMPQYSVVGGRGSTEYDAAGGGYTYTGTGGIGLGGLDTRLTAAIHYKQLSFLLNDAATASGAKLIFDRDPRLRVQKVAPFLKIDGDPYPIVHDNRILWVIDGYTTLANYPYSERESLADLTTDSLTQRNPSAAQPDDTINYIRNSVKATVDAYDGTVSLYQWNDQDPVLKAWMNTFPGLVKAQDQMPADVMDHVRYPEDLFTVQRNMLQRYHVNDPATFYTGSNQWTVPSDPTDSTSPPDQPPYYVQASNPTSPDGLDDSQFQLTSPMNLQQRPLLAAYLSVNCNAGPDYGKMTVLQVPSGLPSPQQAYNNFNSNGTIANDLNRLRSGESAITYGNLLTLPIGNSFLYVEPLYQSASGANGYPQLSRVLVAYGNRLGYEPTLTQALNDLATGQLGVSLTDVGTTRPGDNSPTSSNSPSLTPTTSPPASTSAPSGSLEQQIAAVTAQIAAANTALQTALKNGDFPGVGNALQTISDLSAQLSALQAQQTGSTSASSPPAGSPSASAPSSPAASPSG